MQSNAQLSAVELMHLATLDSRQGKHDQAILKLKACVEMEPDNAWGYHLLAAEHAEIGMTDAAIAEMATATRLDPASAIARFQLGLLHATQGDIANARQAWAPLDTMPGSAHLAAFRNAVLALMEQRIAEALRELERGLSLNFENAGLRKDMMALLRRLSAQKAPADAASQDAGNRVLLRSYLGEGSA